MVKLNFKLIIISFSLFFYACSGETKNKEQTASKYTDQDSIFIFENFLHYDQMKGIYDDADERWIYEYWQENTDTAHYYFKKAVFIHDIPSDLRMIFASYSFNKKADESLVKMILEEPMNKAEIQAVYNIMSSYGIPFSNFGISKETLKKCCPDIKHQ